MSLNGSAPPDPSNCFSIPYFIAFQSTVIFMNAVYIIAFAIIEFYTPFHFMIMSISSYAVLRSFVSMGTVVSWTPGSTRTLLTVSIFIDYACYNFTLATLFQMSVQRYLKLRMSKWSNFFFEDYLFHTWISFFIFTSLLAIAQAALGNASREFSQMNGFVEPYFSKFWLQCVFMKVSYIFPIMIIIVYILFFIHWKKSPRDQTKYKDIPGERNRGILIIFISLLHVTISIFYEYNLWNRNPDHPLQTSIDQILTFSPSVPDLFTPLFLICSIEKFKDRWTEFRSPTVGPSSSTFFTQGA